MLPRTRAHDNSGLCFLHAPSPLCLTPSTALLCEHKGRRLSPNLKSHESPETPLGAERLSALSERWMFGSERTESSLSPLKYQKASYHSVSFMTIWLASSGNVNSPFSSWGQWSSSARGHLGDLIQIYESEWIYTKYWSGTCVWSQTWFYWWSSQC